MQEIIELNTIFSFILYRLKTGKGRSSFNLRNYKKSSGPVLVKIHADAYEVLDDKLKKRN